VAVRHLTGAERTAIERHFGPLREVGTRGDLVEVPDEVAKAVDGAEEISGSATARTTYVRGLGHAEQKADALAEADEASRDKRGPGGASYAGSGGTDTPPPAADTSRNEE